MAKKLGAKPTNAKKVTTSTTKKANQAKQTDDIVKAAAEKLRVSHIYATTTTHSVRHDKKCKKTRLATQVLLGTPFTGCL